MQPRIVWNGSIDSLPQALADGVPYLVWVKDAAGRYIFINETYRRIRKVRNEDRIGLTDHQIHSPQLAKAFRDADLAVIKSQTAVECEDVYTLSEHGFSAIYSTIKRPLFDENGAVTAVYGISFDITEKKCHDEKLTRQKRLLESLHDMSVELIKHRDIDTLLRTLLQRAAQAIGAPIGLMNMLDPKQSTMKIKYFCGPLVGIPDGYAIKKGQALVGQVWEQRKVIVIDDYQQWAPRLPDSVFADIRTIVGVPIFSATEVVGVLTLSHTDPALRFDETDVTALEQFSALASVALENARLFEAAALELQQRRESETLYRSLIEQSSDAILLIDPITRRLLQANKRYLELTGYTSEDIPKLSVYDVVVDEQRWIDQSFDITLPKLRRKPLETRRFRRKDGYVFEMERSVRMVAINERDAVMVVARDVSERRHTRLMEFLHETTLDIIGHLDQAALLQAITHRAVSLADAPFGYCALLDPETADLKVVAISGINATEFTEPPRVNAGLAAQVLASGQAMVLDDYRNWPGRIKGAIFDRITAMAIFPLKNSLTEVVGLLTIVHWDPEKRIQMDDFSCLEEIANLASLALDNAKLYNTAKLEIASRSKIEQKIRLALEKLDATYDTTLEGWARALDLRDCETEGHSRRVASIAVEMAKQMNIPAERHIHIWRGALLHDIGKLGVADSILLKPGPLTAEEWQIMRLHPIYGYDWLHQIEYLHPALAIPRSHHERWDGEGYPDKLKGTDIPIEARLFAPVDVWDALSSNRPYRRSWPDSKIREHIRSLAGSHFDPAVVDAFLSLPPEAFSIREKAPESFNY